MAWLSQEQGSLVRIASEFVRIQITTMTTSNRLDAEIIGHIRQLGGDELLSELIAIYLEQAPVRLGELQNGLAENDMTRAAKAAHSFRSSSVSLGARDIAEEAGAIESLADEGDREGVESLLPEFERSLADLLACLKAEQGESE